MFCEVMLYLFFLDILWLCFPFANGLPWLLGPCSNASEFYKLNHSTLFENATMTDCMNACTFNNRNSISRSEFAVWNQSQKCLCFSSAQVHDLLELLDKSCYETRHNETADVDERSEEVFALLLQGPTLHDISLVAESCGEDNISFKMTARVAEEDSSLALNSRLPLRLETYWFVDGRLVSLDTDIEVDGMTEDLKIESTWNTTLGNLENATIIRVVLNTKIATQSLTRSISDLLSSTFHHKSKNHLCVPTSYEALKSRIAEFCHDDLMAYLKSEHMDFLWIFPSNQTSSNSSKIAKNGKCKIHFVVCHSTTKSAKSMSFTILVITSNDITLASDRNSSHSSQCLALFPVSAKNKSSCQTFSHNASFVLSEFENSNCLVMFTNKNRHFGKSTTCQSYPKLESVTIRTNPIVATQSPTRIVANVQPESKGSDCEIYWNVLDENGTTVFNTSNATMRDLVHTFLKPGPYLIRATGVNRISEISAEVSILVQDPITKANIISPKPITYLAIQSTIQFLAAIETSSGTGQKDVRCSWKLQCLHYSSLFQMLNHTRDIKTCNISHRFTSPVICTVSLTVFNGVSRLELPQQLKVIVEEPVSVLQVYVPAKLATHSQADAVIFVKNVLQSTVDVSVDSVAQEVFYDDHLRAYRFNFVSDRPGVNVVRLRVRNNVSSVVLRKNVLVLSQVGPVDILTVGCRAVGLPLRFLILVKGIVPSQGDTFLYHWTIATEWDATSFYTSVPVAESEIRVRPGDVEVTVRISNGVSSNSTSTTVSVRDVVPSPCLHHASVIELGQPVDFEILGLPSGLLFGNVSLHIVRENSSSAPTAQQNFNISSSTFRWRYLSQSTGFHSVMCFLFFELSDSAASSSKLFVRTGYQVVRRLHGLRIYAPRTVYLTRFPTTLKWRADATPHSEGCVFYWKLHGHKYVTATPQLTVELYYPPGTYHLDLEVRNALGDRFESSMVFEVAATLLLLNYTLSNFFVHQNGSISLEINQLYPPEALFVDFGDDTTYDSNDDRSLPGSPIASTATATTSSNNGTTSVLTLYHTYRHPGLYDVYINATGSNGAGFNQWVSVVVEEKMAGVELVLLSNSPVVELLEEVTVMCLVRRGTNLQFRWDFGDGTDGEQYTRQDVEYSKSRGTNCTAHHSYGIARAYNVSVLISNSYESLRAYLGADIRAVEPVVQLHLHPRIKGRYAAPLSYSKSKKRKDEGSTSPVEFEAGVWRGSDVHFSFDFGDGSAREEVPALLNAWSHPYAVVKHVYTAEGSYDITVKATNLLSSVNASLGRPFYVQFPPENLVLDKQYYIIERHSNITLRATISQGTNVSYNWRVGDMHLTSAENTLFLASLQPGIYIVIVEAFNHVTDYGYSAMRRPNATAKIYVQEKLLGIQICVKVNTSEICNPGVLDLPLEEEVEFRAKVIPSTETVLRFIWQLGKEEIRRTNIPVFTHKYQQARWYSINVTAQNHISSISSISLQLNLVQRVGNLTSIFCQGPNLVKHPITYRAFYWFGTNLTFQWDFGDGSLPLLTTSSSVQHTYNEVGEYWVTVNVWNKFSKANITTNMFFLHHVCQKPEITFLHQKNRIARHDMDTLIEADISVICKTANVEYIWTVKEVNGRSIPLDSINILNQRQLVIPKFFLRTGTYTVYLKVKMIGTIVYAESSTQLEIVLPHPVLYIRGGFIQWVGADDSRKLIASIMNLDQANHTLQYEWSCIPQLQKHLPCLKNSELLQSNLSPELYIPTSEISPSLESIIINVTIKSNKLLSATQLLEIKPVPHMLHVSLECEQCHDHHINPHEKLVLKASCQNCGLTNLEYQWKIWIIEDGKFRLHFGNYECVQADGSTFFIMAPNSTQEESFVNATYLSNEDLDIPLVNTSTDHMLAEKPYETEDLPPFPNLPGFPEENGTTAGQKVSRNARSTFDEDLYESPDLIPISDYPYEGDANYDDSNFTDYPYPDFMPFPVPGSPLEGPDYLITEEGLPGESGSAAARHQSSQHLGIILSEDEDQILEEAGKPRMKPSGTTNVLANNPNERGDPFRDRFSKKMPAPHIVSRPRGLLTSDDSLTTTGFNSEYLVLKSGVLKVGRSYLVQAKITSSGHDLEGFAMEYFRVSVGPINGRCTLMPLDGYSINFDYRLHCLEWKSDHFPLYYELSYSRNPDDLGHLIYFGLNENVKFNLPSGFASNAHSIYLNVLVRDSLGVPTKVCSIVRTVKPFSSDTQVEHTIYNETFHSKASLKKLIGEKNNQAVLQKLHVLASSLNNYEFISTDNKSDPESFSIRSKIRQEFFEIINGIQIRNKVEAAQLISVLNQIIADIQTIKLFELQKAHNLYEKMDDLQTELYDFFASEHLHHEFMIFLSKLAFASHFIQPRNDELVAIARAEVIHQMKKALKTKLTTEEPSKVDIPHLTVSSLYITEYQLISKPFIVLKSVAVQFLNNSYLLSKIEKKASKRCDYEECLTFVVQEYDYIAPSPGLYISNITKAASSVLLSLNSLDHFEEENITLNVSVQFLREEQVEEGNKISLMGNYMNVHTINITEKHIHHSLLFHIQVESINATEDSTAVIDIMFRHLNHPTLTKYDLKKSFPAISKEAAVLIPPEKMKEPGLYYISVLSRDFQEKTSVEYVMWEYEVSLWKDVCLGKVASFWSVADCYVMETTNHNSTHCKCSSNEVTAFSAVVEWELSWVPISDLIEPYFNPLPLLVFVILVLLYFLLVYLNLKKDKWRYLSCSPVPLRDNSNKHKQLYLVCVKTGFYFSSGTTASVYIVLHGTKDVTETRQLIGKNVNKLFFQKGSVDVFLLSTERSLGPLLKLEVWHNNEGASPSWYLKDVSVKHLNAGSTYIFNCYDWLSAERGDGQIERELAVVENQPSFMHVFYENLIMGMNDFNMWNALVLESPTSFFTGVQRITCCLCFILNCALFISLFTSTPWKEEKDNFLPNLAITTFVVSTVAALVATIPITIYIVLLRFSKQPFVDVNPKFLDFFHWLCPYRFNCRLKPKRSTSSRSTGDRSSSSIEGSDSLYSSFENSSIISVQESFSVEEKDVLPLSYSYSDISDPVSPLQNTLSTWQTLENWLKKKQSLILNPEVIPMKRQRSYLSDGEISFNSDKDSEDNQTWQQSSALMETSNTESSDIVSVLCQDMNEDLNLNCFFPFMHKSFYYVGWLILMANIFGSTIFVLIKMSRFSLPHSVLVLKMTFLSVICSCIVIIPILILLFSFFCSIWFILLSRKQKVSTPQDNSEKDKKLHKVDLSTSSYSRVEYFKKYLRPPKEEILEQFRQIAIQEKRICHFYSGVWNFAVLLLLIAATYPGHSQVKYLQKSSIENALFRSIPKETKMFSTKNSLLSWLESDFLDGFLADHQCFNVDEDCGMSTKCIFVGSVILRHFYSSKLSNSSLKLSNNFGNVYERRKLRGFYGLYHIEDEWQVLSDQMFYLYDEMQDFVEKLNASSAGSLEFLLFNPTFSTFVSVSFLFEMTSLGAIHVTHEILPVVISSSNSFPGYLKLFFNLIFFIFMLFGIKNQVWKMIKHKSQYWKQIWSHWSLLFIFVYFIYVSFFVLHIIQSEEVLSVLINTQLNSNVNIAEVVVFEYTLYVSVGILTFIHIIGCIKVLSFSHRLKKMLKRLIQSQSQIFSTIIALFIAIVPFIVIIKHFIGSSLSSSHPLFGLFELALSIFKDCKKPEITEFESPIKQCISIFTSITLICIHACLFSFIRSVLLNPHPIDDNWRKKCSFKSTKNVIKNKFLAHFKPCSSQTASKVKYVPPVDILLFELERIADVLVTKVNNLFPEDYNDESSSKSECELDKNELKMESDIIADILETCANLDDFILDERLISTMPRRTKGNLNAFLPSSFHTSLGSEKKYQTLEMSTSLSQSKIRKTYPLFSNLDSDSTTSGINLHELEGKLDSVNSLSVRKTKSRGKNDDFELNIEASDSE